MRLTIPYESWEPEGLAISIVDADGAKFGKCSVQHRQVRVGSPISSRPRPGGMRFVWQRIPRRPQPHVSGTCPRTCRQKQQLVPQRAPLSATTCASKRPQHLVRLGRTSVATCVQAFRIRIPPQVANAVCEHGVRPPFRRRHPLAIVQCCGKVPIFAC